MIDDGVIKVFVCKRDGFMYLVITDFVVVEKMDIEVSTEKRFQTPFYVRQDVTTVCDILLRQR